MISALHRFHGYASLRFVYRKGHVVRGPLFSVRVIENKRSPHFRVAVVVSRKVNKSAVVRNKIRRRLYEAVRKERSRILAPHDIVISVFHDSVATTPIEQISRQLNRQLSEAGVFSQPSA